MKAFMGFTAASSSILLLSACASTGTAGNFGITLMLELARIPIFLANTPLNLDALALAMPTIPDDACLAFAYVSSTTSTGQVQGLLSLAQG